MTDELSSDAADALRRAGSDDLLQPGTNQVNSKLVTLRIANALMERALPLGSLDKLVTHVEGWVDRGAPVAKLIEQTDPELRLFHFMRGEDEATGVAYAQDIPWWWNEVGK